MTPAEIRIVLVRSKARQFASMVKASNMAHKLPEETIDWLKDEEIPAFMDRLRDFGLVKRDDHLWERREG